MAATFSVTFDKYTGEKLWEIAYTSGRNLADLLRPYIGERLVGVRLDPTTKTGAIHVKADNGVTAKQIVTSALSDYLGTGIFSGAKLSEATINAIGGRLLVDETAQESWNVLKEDVAAKADQIVEYGVDVYRRNVYTPQLGDAKQTEGTTEDQAKALAEQQASNEMSTKVMLALLALFVYLWLR